MLRFISKLFTPHGEQRVQHKRRRFVEIVGESHYQEALSRIAGGKTYDGHTLPVTAHLIAENGNPHDAMAVRVEINSMTVGYLSRYQARQFRKRTASAVDCEARIVGGWDRGHGDTGQFGVELDLTL